MRKRLVQVSIGGVLLAAGVFRFAGGVETLQKREGKSAATSRAEAQPPAAPVTRLVSPPVAAPSLATPAELMAEAEQPGPIDPTLRLVSRTTGEIALLDRQKPETFLTGMLPPPGDSRHDAKLNERVVAASRAYIRERTDLLREMMVSYVETEGTYDFTGDLERLRAVDQAYRDAVAELETQLPGVSQLPDVLGASALPLPAFAEEAQRAIHPEAEITFNEPPTDNTTHNENTLEEGTDNHEIAN
jgi:hypothetical protein